MKRPIRILAAWLALFTVCFSQIAVAGHACPFVASPVEMTAPMDGGCDGMPTDPDQPALCHAHGQQGDQSLDKPLVPMPLPALLPALVSDWRGGSGLAPGPPGGLRSLLARATAPPLALRHCCLRL